MHSLIEMLKYRRPQGSNTQAKFCKRFLEPVFGKADSNGNYVLTIGDSPRVMFTAHHDTVHTRDGFQIVSVTGDIATTSDKDSNCLGADCTTGMWIILGMIEHGIPGLYVVFAAEESGCVGSRAMANANPDYLGGVQACVSFDRKGQESIVTHQCGMRTASDAFAVSLSQTLNMPCLRPDPTGVYTDSESFAHIIPECTNVSVGYLAQHTKQESQDLFFADSLLESLIKADWQSLVIERDPDETFCEEYCWRGFSNPYHAKQGRNIAALENIVREYPDAIAELLDSYGMTPEEIFQELGLNPYYDASPAYLER